MALLSITKMFNIKFRTISKDVERIYFMQSKKIEHLLGENGPDSSCEVDKWTVVLKDNRVVSVGR